jgi:prepilin-type N-terminal cleavage/methylation domain-containing protein
VRRRRRGGVTLIELLIAVTLVGLLTMGILFAMRVGLGAMDAVERKFAGGRRVVGAQRVLDQQIAGLIPVQIQCGGPREVPALFFQGERYAMRFVSSYTLEEGARGYPRVVEYLVMPPIS